MAILLSPFIGILVGFIQAYVVCSIRHVPCNDRLVFEPVLRNAFAGILVNVVAVPFSIIPGLHNDNNLSIAILLIISGGFTGLLTTFIFFKTRDGFGTKMNARFFMNYSTVSGGHCLTLTHAPSAMSADGSRSGSKGTLVKMNIPLA